MNDRNHKDRESSLAHTHLRTPAQSDAAASAAVSTMSFAEAVAYVREAAQENVAAYAVIPLVKRGRTTGGKFYIVAHQPEDATDPDDLGDVCVHVLDGEYGDDMFVEEETLELDEVPEEAADLRYRPTSTFDPSVTGYVLEVVHRVLEGMPLDQARDADD